MRTVFLLLAVALAAPASAQSARNMTTERVQFEPGRFGTDMDRTIRAGETHRYLVRAERGQTLNADLNWIDEADAESILVQVYAPGRRITARNAAPSADGGRFDLGYWTGRLARSGDYQVVVYLGQYTNRSAYTLSLYVSD